jgi:hypothetical protein
LKVTGERVSSMTRFGDRSLFACFGLPRTIPRQWAAEPPTFEV